MPAWHPHASWFCRRGPPERRPSPCQNKRLTSIRLTESLLIKLIHLLTSPNNSLFCWCPPQCVFFSFVLTTSNIAHCFRACTLRRQTAWKYRSMECNVGVLGDIISYNGKTLLCFRQTTAFLMRGIAKLCFL